ncbi:polysaccharide lyase family 8 super-sandwich domain-containing protein [Ruania halotolerans]|uniref:polysaccharide lyase family 8 super-sandwich domain-containing protein n=1 Tax=Ruania halotolerans TaxID=2897773 RepID=UPI001E2866F2|nr:polysaccharide lyase family 8 super-sandwich domain-containing protein [Ruania halotolerans]UFU04859.1 polysaccharide lyase beta-sandwich domain-containing protein [Ruania halotolerans]
MQLTRRHVLSIIPAAGLFTVGAPLLAHADTPTQHTRLLANTVAMLAGTTESNARPEVAPKVAAIESAAQIRLADMADAGAGELFAGQPLGSNDTHLRRTTTYLYEIALATRTPGSDLLDDVDVQRQVIDGLVWLHEHYLADQQAGYYGNWFNWEIGFPTDVTRTLVLLADELATYRPDLVTTYIATMDAYLRNGVGGDVNLDSRFHTGANLADITTNRILQGALTGDDARISKAIADQSTVFATIDPYNLAHGVTDGYYADGSFIQHHSVAYTGSYGKGLLTRVVQTVKILDGTSQTSNADLVAVVTGWVRHGFAPLIYQGWMMEIVKGRAVSRTTTGYTDVRVVAEAIVDLSAYASDQDASDLEAYVKHLDSASPEMLDSSRFDSPVSIARFAQIVGDSSIPAADLNPDEDHVAFNAMDRTVHRRPGYAFALARSSDRISKYEYMNGENLLPWFQGDGAHHLYLSDVDQTEAFGVDYYTTVAPYRFGGVTAPVEERRSIPELYGERWYENPDHPLEFTSSSQSQNTYVYFPRGTNPHSGGATLGSLGAVAMVLSDDVAYADKQAGILPEDFVTYQNASATKSWFMFDDEVVVLAAGIDGRSGRDAVTSLDSRIANPGDDVQITGALRDGSPWSGTGEAPLAWLRYVNADQGGAVGYVLLDEHDVDVTLEVVTRSRRAIRLSNPNTRVTKQVFGLSVNHPAGSGPDAIAYALLPHADEASLAAYPGPLSVLRNNDRVQAVKHTGLGVVAANVFVEGTHQAERLAIDGPASVIARRRDGAVELAVSDPTMRRESVSVTVRGRPLALAEADDGVTVARVPGGTKVTVRTHQAHGRTFTATLT